MTLRKRSYPISLHTAAVSKGAALAPYKPFASGEIGEGAPGNMAIPVATATPNLYLIDQIVPDGEQIPLSPPFTPQAAKLFRSRGEREYNSLTLRRNCSLACAINCSDMDWDLAIKIAGPLAAVSTIPVFFWTNLRNDVKRTAIIDLATKRIAFWNQLLTTVNLATVEDSPERKAERDKAYQAIQRIQEDATVQLQMLSRTRKVNRTIGWKSFRFERAKFRTWRDAVFWWYFVFLSVAMLCLSALIFVRIEYKIFARNLQGIHLSVDLLMNFAFIALGRLFLYQAESLKHDSATAPIIDSI